LHSTNQDRIGMKFEKHLSSISARSCSSSSYMLASCGAKNTQCIDRIPIAHAWLSLSPGAAHRCGRCCLWIRIFYFPAALEPWQAVNVHDLQYLATANGHMVDARSTTRAVASSRVCGHGAHARVATAHERSRSRAHRSRRAPLLMALSHSIVPPQILFSPSTNSAMSPPKCWRRADQTHGSRMRTEVVKLVLFYDWEEAVLYEAKNCSGPKDNLARSPQSWRQIELGEKRVVCPRVWQY
jgi:hypothetical protein